ncbi:MAG: tryptophan synthase subunit alpha [Bacteroidales bacterium]
MNRINELFAAGRGNILSVYFTAGYPTIDSASDIIRDLEYAGADMVEIGMPFSDPVADGPVIQGSSSQALRNGMSISLLFEQIETIRRTVNIPLLLMGYLNPVLKFGVERFASKCRDTGIDGVIIPDLPPEIYMDQYQNLFSEYGLVNVFLISPCSSDERIRLIDSISNGFIYMVSTSSTTGIRNGFTEIQRSYFGRIKAMNLSKPRLLGFGISDRSTFTTACEMADGAVIGSAFVRTLGEIGNSRDVITEFVAKIR